MREVIKCPHEHCRLNQFVTSDGNCRRCRKALVPLPEPVRAIEQPVPMAPLQPHQLADAVSAALKVLRIAHGYSQRDLAELLSVPRTFVSRLETKAVTATCKTLAKYAAVFNVSLSHFFQIVEAIYG